MHAMTKNNKLLFWIGLGLVLIPEVLFSYIVGSVASLSGKDFLILPLHIPGITDNNVILLFILGLQMFGSVLIIYTTTRSSLSRFAKISLGTLFGIVLIFQTIIMYAGVSINSMSLP